jgi:hypothetical protein
MFDTSRHVQRFQQLERVWQWVILAVVFLILFLVWSEGITPMSDGWAQQSDQIELDLQRTASGAQMDRTTTSAAMIYGPLELPNMKPAGSLELTEVVQGILADNGITNDTFYQSQSTNIKTGTLPGLARAGEKLERIKGELDFESKPDVAMNIISQLEQNPVIEAVSYVSIRKEGAGSVRTKLTIEAWVRAR